MEKSTFEKVSNSQLKKYLQFVYRVLGNTTFDNITECYDNIVGSPLEKKLAGPLGLSELSRLDIEYLYYLLTNNDPENETFDRPQLGGQPVDWVVVEKIRIKTTRSNDLLTYVQGDIDEEYLNALRMNDDIEPYDWEVIDKDEEGDDIIDDYFEI